MKFMSVGGRQEVERWCAGAAVASKRLVVDHELDRAGGVALLGNPEDLFADAVASTAVSPLHRPLARGRRQTAG